VAAAEHAAAVAAAEAAAEAEIRAALGPAAAGGSSSRSAAAGSRRSRNSTGVCSRLLYQLLFIASNTTVRYCMTAYLAACIVL
jgi:hypothetical protein